MIVSGLMSFCAKLEALAAYVTVVRLSVPLSSRFDTTQCSSAEVKRPLQSRFFLFWILPPGEKGAFSWGPVLRSEEKIVSNLQHVNLCKALQHSGVSSLHRTSEFFCFVLLHFKVTIERNTGFLYTFYFGGGCCRNGASREYI